MKPESLSDRCKEALTWVQDYLSRRSHSEKELLEKLAKKDFKSEVAQEALAYAKKRGWMEDPLELSEKVYQSWDRKNKSHIWIKGYLEEKGLPEQDKNFSREIEKALYHLEKKFGRIDNDNYKKASQHIASKGFSYGEFKEAVEKLKDKVAEHEQ